jgi:hypothetical protein
MAIKTPKERATRPKLDFLWWRLELIEYNCNSIFIVVSDESLICVYCIGFNYAILANRNLWNYWLDFWIWFSIILWRIILGGIWGFLKDLPLWLFLWINQMLEELASKFYWFCQLNFLLANLFNVIHRLIKIHILSILPIEDFLFILKEAAFCVNPLFFLPFL